MPPVRSSKDRRSSRIQARRLSVIQVPQESQNANLNVTNDADNHSPPQPNDQMMNLVQSLTNSVTSLQQQVSAMAKKLEPRNIAMNSTCSTTTSAPEEVLPGLNLGTEHVQFQQFVNDTNNNMGCVNNLSAIASHIGNQPLQNNVNLVGNESSSRYYMHQAVPLGATISEIFKRQIWANDFIELGKLLPESIEKTLKPKTLQVESLSNPVLTLKEQDNTITSLDLWLTAFSIYMSIYIEKHPGSVSGMLKYMEVVREIAKRKGNWHNYDRKFRLTKSQLTLTWGVTHQEIYVESLLDRTVFDNTVKVSSAVQGGQLNLNRSSTQYNQSVPQVPVGYCVKFHTGKFCAIPCRYSHNCYKCSRLHPSIRCYIAGIPNVSRLPGGQDVNFSFRNGNNNFRPHRTPFTNANNFRQNFRPRTSHTNTSRFAS